MRGTHDKGKVVDLNTSHSYNVDCYVDVDFAGILGVEGDQYPICAKSRTRFFIIYIGWSLLWNSKLQTRVELSIMESEYFALSQSMLELIAVREILK